MPTHTPPANEVPLPPPAPKSYLVPEGINKPHEEKKDPFGYDGDWTTISTLWPPADAANQFLDTLSAAVEKLSVRKSWIGGFCLYHGCDAEVGDVISNNYVLTVLFIQNVGTVFTKETLESLMTRGAIEL